MMMKERARGPSRVLEALGRVQHHDQTGPGAGEVSSQPKRTLADQVSTWSEYCTSDWR